MKIINSNNVVDEIRNALVKGCGARSLDDSEDFEVVMQTISHIIDQWMVNRCEGCR